MLSLFEINMLIKGGFSEKLQKEQDEAKQKFFAHLVECDRCGLMPSSEDDRTCADGKPSYERARLLKAI